MTNELMKLALITLAPDFVSDEVCRVVDTGGIKRMMVNADDIGTHCISISETGESHSAVNC